MITSLGSITKDQVDALTETLSAIEPDSEGHMVMNHLIAQYAPFNLFNIKRIGYMIAHETSLKSDDFVISGCGSAECIAAIHQIAISLPYAEMYEPASPYLNVERVLLHISRLLEVTEDIDECWLERMTDSTPRLESGVIQAFVYMMTGEKHDRIIAHEKTERTCHNPRHSQGTVVEAITSPEQASYKKAMKNTWYECSDEMKEVIFGKFVRAENLGYRDILLCESRKIIYEKEGQALQAIKLWRNLHVKKGNQMSQYKCGICRYWHLTSRYG